MTPVKSRLGRQPYAWSEHRTNEVSSAWMGGKTITSIAEVTGLSASTISRKIKELGLSNIERPGFKRAERVLNHENCCTSWDERVFESYADRKVRLARERAA